MVAVPSFFYFFGTRNGMSFDGWLAYGKISYLFTSSFSNSGVYCIVSVSLLWSFGAADNNNLEIGCRIVPADAQE